MMPCRKRGFTSTQRHFPLWKWLHIGKDMFSCVLRHPLCCRFLASREDWIDRQTQRKREKERDRERERGGATERESPTGGSNNLQDSGLCRCSPTELPVDQILQFRSKTTPSFSSEIMHTNTHSQIYSNTHTNTHTHTHSAPFDYSSVSWQQGHLILASDTKVFVNLD